MNKPPIEVDNFGGAPFAEHNQLCHVCWVAPAVLLLNNGVFQPCDACQDRGWTLIQVRSQYLKRILRRLRLEWRPR